MLYNKKNIVIFGSGEAASAIIGELTTHYNIVEIWDNNSEKWNEIWNGKLIVKPNNKSNFDYIYIASMYVKDIKRQLLDMGVPHFKICIPAKNQLKQTNHAFQNANNKKIAIDLLDYLHNLFLENNIEYYLAYGTLLGVIRDGELIPWDDDIDIQVKSENKKKLESIFLNIEKKLVDSHPSVRLEFITNEENKVKNRIIVKQDDKIIFNVDFTFLENRGHYYLENNTYIYEVKYYNKPKHIEWKSIQICIPNDHTELLEYIYGEGWKIPNKNFTFDDYQIERTNK